jgi:hypothetical protein
MGAFVADLVGGVEFFVFSIEKYYDQEYNGKLWGWQPKEGDFLCVGLIPCIV